MAAYNGSQGRALAHAPKRGEVARSAVVYHILDSLIYDADLNDWTVAKLKAVQSEQLYSLA